jgi:hypothetical protein
MDSPLPSKTFQRKKLYRPSLDETYYLYKVINRHVFDNQLKRPEIRIKQLPKQWGNCLWSNRLQPTGSHCIITMVPNWFCPQWYVQTLAHEMVHQYQWDIYRFDHLDYYGRPMFENSGAHGPSFFAWRERFADYGMYLKTWYGQKRWFKHQDFTKC